MTKPSFFGFILKFPEKQLIEVPINVVAEQTEYSHKNILEIGFVIVMDFVGNSGEKDIRHLIDFLQISVFHGIRQLFRECGDILFGTAGVGIQQIGVERVAHFRIGEIQHVVHMVELGKRGLDGQVSGLQKQGDRLNVIRLEIFEGEFGNRFCQNLFQIYSVLST